MPAPLSPETEKQYRRLLVADTQNRLPGVAATETSQLDEAACAHLMSVASVLALSPHHEDKSTAYEICTRICALLGHKSPSLLSAASFILARLGNFPGRALLETRHPLLADSDGAGGPYLFLEAMAREVENTVADAGGKPMSLTDFQFDTLEAFSNSKAVSISAPTSAGKSFVLSLEVIRRLKKFRPSCVVYLVPTRALIRQVVLHLREDLKKAQLSHVPVRSVPQPIDKALAPDGAVYVLTQERLLSPLFSDGDPNWITTLIVDEAQGIGDGARGVLLQTAIEKVVTRFPNADVLFASPKSSNPEYLLELFHLYGGRPFLEQHSPVSQNLVLVQPGASKENVNFQLVLEDESIDLGDRNLEFSIVETGILSRRAKFALKTNSSTGSCIVYANGARDTETIAEEISNQLGEPEELDSRISEFIQFLEDHVHKEYGLIGVLKRGVAFHYSNMPGSVRAGVEELCKAGKLSFICCTSTLLQGVNLPARDIIVENPKRGIGKPMVRADFVNLAGRAGRLMREFHGNVWCLRPDLWDEKTYEGPSLQKIESAFAQCLRDGGTSIRKLFDDDSSLEDRERDVAVATLGRVYTEFIVPGNAHLLETFVTSEYRDSLQATINAFAGIKTEIPVEIIARNHGVLPMRLERLYLKLHEASDVRSLMPAAPYSKEGNPRLYTIFETVERLLQEDTTDRFKYYWRIAKEWVHQKHLQAIIAERIAYLHTLPEPVNVRNVIYETIEDLEKIIRYRFVKHLRAYNDVLQHVLRQKGYVDEAEHLVPMHLFLECGASDPDALSLISIGLSRTSALLLKARNLFPRDANPEQCMEILSRMNLNTSSLPAFCKREIANLIGITL